MQKQHGNKGKKRSKESRMKMSRIRKLFYKNGGIHPRGNKGKKFSPETCKKMSAALSEEKNPMWKGGRTSAKGGYIRIRIEKNIYMLEHRRIMELHIGRKLEKSEIVHHIDGNRKNNEITNLMLLKNQKEHRELHVKNEREKIHTRSLRVLHASKDLPTRTRQRKC